MKKIYPDGTPSVPPATLNLREAANRLGVSIPTVRRLLSRRYLTTLVGIRHKRITAVIPRNPGHL